MVSALPGSEQAPHSACTPSSSSSSSRRRHVLVAQGVSAGPSATLGGGGTAGSEVGQRSQEPPCSAGLCPLVFRALGAAVSPPHSSPRPNLSFTTVLPSQKTSPQATKPVREHFYQWTGRIVQQNPTDRAGVWILYSIKVHSVLEAETKQWEIQLLSPGNCSADSRGGSNPHYAINQRMQGDSVIEVKSKIPSCHWEKALASGQKYVLCRPASDAQDQEPSSLGKIVQWQNKGLN